MSIVVWSISCKWGHLIYARMAFSSVVKNILTNKSDNPMLKSLFSTKCAANSQSKIPCLSNKYTKFDLLRNVSANVSRNVTKMAFQKCLAEILSIQPEESTNQGAPASSPWLRFLPETIDLTPWIEILSRSSSFHRPRYGSCPARERRREPEKSHGFCMATNTVGILIPSALHANDYSCRSFTKRKQLTMEVVSKCSLQKLVAHLRSSLQQQRF